MARNRIGTARGTARPAHAGILPGLGRLKLARTPAPMKPSHAGALPDPAGLKFTREQAWPLPQPENRIALFRSVAIALSAHALVLWLVLPSTAPELTRGGGGQHLEAIEVTLLRSPVIESRDKNRAEKPSGANSEMAPKAGERSKPATPTPPEDVPRTADEPLLKHETRPAPLNNGATARAIEENGRSSGPASAAPGAIQQYAAKVREALARNKPGGFGNRGTAAIKFSISPEGKAGPIEVETSSGIPVLDKSAIDAVANTSFPAPPAGMTEAERTYVVPFHFK
jgi:TonB family protein